jgi:hypothetical protein
MTDIIIQIMIDVFTILGIATKEGKYLLHKCDTVDGTMFREICEEADGKEIHRRCSEEEARQADS